MGNMLGTFPLNGGATVKDLKNGLKNAGFRAGAYVTRNADGHAFRISLGR